MTAPLRPVPLRERLAGGAPLVAVSFSLGGRLYAMEAALAEEVVLDAHLHPLPDMPPALLGMLPLRGALLPVLELARLVGLPSAAAGPDAAVLVLALPPDGHRVGLRVDAPGEVLTLPPDALRLLSTAEQEATRWTLGFARLGEALLTLLDPAQALAGGGTPLLQELP